MAAEVHVHDWPLSLDTCSCNGLEVDVMVDVVEGTLRGSYFRRWPQNGFPTAKQLRESSHNVT